MWWVRSKPNGCAKHQGAWHSPEMLCCSALSDIGLLPSLHVPWLCRTVFVLEREVESQCEEGERISVILRIDARELFSPTHCHHQAPYCNDNKTRELEWEWLPNFNASFVFAKVKESGRERVREREGTIERKSESCRLNWISLWELHNKQSSEKVKN